MKNLWFAPAVVALLAVGSGVAIGWVVGGNDSADADTSAVTTEVSDPTTTSSSTTSPAPTTDATATTDATTTTDASTTTDSSTTTGATSTTTEASASTDETAAAATTGPGELAAREDLQVASVNGANIDGAATRMVDRLEALGYVDVVALDGSDFLDFTIVYYVDGFESAAARLAGDLELFVTFIAPIDNAPVLVGLPDDAELVVYVGSDRAL